MKKVLVETFSNIGDLTTALSTRKNNSGMEGENEAAENDYDFTKTKNYEEAEQLLRFGFSDVIPEIKEQIKKCKYNRKDIAKKPRQQNGIVGYIPNVPNAIQGRIDNMISSEKVIIKKKTLSVVYLIGANCDKGTDYFIKAGAALIAAIESIEKSGVQVELNECFFSAKSNHREDSNKVYGILKIKSFGHRFDLKKITFPLAHPSMFRRFGFKWLETVPNMDDKSFSCGYGSAINNHEIEKNDLKEYFPDNTVVINVYQINEKFKNSVEEIIKYLNANN